MLQIADVKMVLLAALIVLTPVLCVPDEDRLGDADPILRHAPRIETLILTG